MNHSISFSCSSFDSDRRLEFGIDPLLRGCHVREGRGPVPIATSSAAADTVYRIDMIASSMTCACFDFPPGRGARSLRPGIFAVTRCSAAPTAAACSASKRCCPRRATLITPPPPVRCRGRPARGSRRARRGLVWVETKAELGAPPEDVLGGLGPFVARPDSRPRAALSPAPKSTPRSSGAGGARQEHVDARAVGAAEPPHDLRDREKGSAAPCCAAQSSKQRRLDVAARQRRASGSTAPRMCGKVAARWASACSASRR